MVYIFLANGFEEIEALCPLDLMLRAGIEVRTVSINNSLEVIGSHGITVMADMKISELDSKIKPELVMLPGGGMGTENLGKNEAVIKQIIDSAGRRAYIAAICAAPSILGKLGLLDGRNAVCYPGFEKYLKGAVISDEKVVRDGNFITGQAMGASFEFGLMLVEIICGSEKAAQIKKSIYFGVE